MEFHYSIWLSILPTLVALAAAAFAYRASRAAQQAAATVRQAPGAPHPPLIVTVVDGRARRDLPTDTRDYAFLLAIENASAADTTVTDVELRVSYRTRANFCGAVDLALDMDGHRADVQPRLHIPLRLGAGQAASGWIEFHTANVIPRHCRIDGYSVIATDAGGGRTIVDASRPAVIGADTDGRGPQAWGWD